METIKLNVGSVGNTWGSFAVEFEGELIGIYDPRSYNDTRGRVEKLYRTADGGLVVYIHTRSCWQGEYDQSYIKEIGEADLLPNGAFEQLGHECNMSRPMTLEEALARGR